MSLARTCREAGPHPKPLTERQATVFALVNRYVQATGEPCSASYVARRLEIRHEAVRGHFGVLYRKGWLRSETSPATPRFLDRR